MIESNVYTSILGRNWPVTRLGAAGVILGRTGHAAKLAEGWIFYIN